MCPDVSGDGLLLSCLLGVVVNDDVVDVMSVCLRLKKIRVTKSYYDVVGECNGKVSLALCEIAWTVSAPRALGSVVRNDTFHVDAPVVASLWLM